MGLYKRGKVFWSYITMDGLRHNRTTGTGNRRIAEQIDHQFREELNRKRFQIKEPEPQLTFAQLSVRFLANADVKAWHVDRLKLLLPYWEKVPIGHIHKGLALEYRRSRHQHKKVSDVTINRDLEALRHLLFWAVDEGILPENPLQRMRMAPERRKPRRVLSLPDEEKLIVAAAPHLRPIIVAALDTGMRRGELLSQRWEHVDLARNLLAVTHSKTAGGEGRDIPLTKRLAGYLRFAKRDTGIVFTFNHSPIQRIKTGWASAIRRAGIHYCRFHDLRHTFNTRLMEAGVLQEIRKALMGHSSGEEINAIYTHVELPVKRQAIQRLETWCAEQRDVQREDEGGEYVPEKTTDNSTLPAGIAGLLPSGT